jgi:hypothetical protein
MTQDGSKPPRNPYPSDEAPTVRTDLAELLERAAQYREPAAGLDEDTVVTELADLEPLPDEPAPEPPRAVRRKRVQTVMGVAPPPVAMAQRAAAVAPPAPFAVPGTSAPVAQPPPPASPPPARPEPPTPARSEPSVQIAQNPERTGPRRADALLQPAPRVRVPFSALLGSTLLSALVGAAAGLAVVLLAPAQPPPAEREARAAPHAANTEAETEKPAQAPPKRPASPALLDRARSGESGAVAELEAKPPAERSVEEALALSEGRGAVKRAELAELRSSLASDPKPAADKLEKLRRWADDADLTREALGAMASLPGPIAADLVYDVWVGNPGRTVATTLAEELVQTRALRDKASPALSVALDLRRAKTCDEVGPLIERAKQVGDRRAMHLIGRLTRRKACGLDSDAACVPCGNRFRKEITEAVIAVQGRKPPKL